MTRLVMVCTMLHGWALHPCSQHTGIQSSSLGGRQAALAQHQNCAHRSRSDLAAAGCALLVHGLANRLQMARGHLQSLQCHCDVCWHSYLYRYAEKLEGWGKWELGCWLLQLLLGHLHRLGVGPSSTGSNCSGCSSPSWEVAVSCSPKRCGSADIVMPGLG
jgi:hypothetical protein